MLIAVTNTVRRKGDYYATARREHLQAEGWSVGGPLYSRPDTCRQGRVAAPNTVEAEIEAKELARIIEAFLDTLTTENRVIFMRRYWFSDSYKDIAEFMGLSEKNISVRLTRIREKMKQYLIEREVFV